MIETTTEKTQETASGMKTPGTRLFDLLAGWADFVDCGQEHGTTDSGLTAYEIADMYQAAAAEIFQLEGEAEVQAVRRWVLDRILPTLLRTTEPTAAADAVSETA